MLNSILLLYYFQVKQYGMPLKSHGTEPIKPRSLDPNHLLMDLVLENWQNVRVNVKQKILYQRCAKE